MLIRFVRRFGAPSRQPPALTTYGVRHRQARIKATIIEDTKYWDREITKASASLSRKANDEDDGPVIEETGPPPIQLPTVAPGFKFKKTGVVPVSFVRAVEDKAKSRGLTGWVKKDPTGFVVGEIWSPIELAQDQISKLESMQKWLTVQEKCTCESKDPIPPEKTPTAFKKKN